jgi:DNA topoisomerase-1
MRVAPRFESETEAKRNVVAAIDSVAKKLGHTRAVCRRAYVHPAVIETYLDGSIESALDLEGAAEGRRLRADEAAVLAFLKRTARVQGRKRRNEPEPRAA